MESKLLVSKEELRSFMAGGAMNHQYGIQVYCELDKEKAQALLPPPLKLVEPALGFVYIVNIREPTFGPWYMEGGLGVMAEYNGVCGVHFLGLMLSGPGALMGMCSGREGSGLPKKLCERIHVERFGDTGHCFIERDGVRLIDVELNIGAYNDPMMRQYCGAQEASTPEHPVDTEGGCLLFRYTLSNLADSNPYKDMRMTHYESPTRFRAWEPASASMTLRSSVNDPWGELPVTRVLGAGWMVSDNWVRGQSVLHEYPDSEATEVMRYLFTGRFDRFTLHKNHQIYE